MTYDGACEDFLVEVTNTGGAIGFSLGIDKDGTTFGTFNELTVVGTQNPPDGWEQNSPGFDYSSFTPVIRGQTRSSPAVYPALLREFGASEVTIRNGNVPTGLVSGYKISGQYC